MLCLISSAVAPLFPQLPGATQAGRPLVLLPTAWYPHVPAAGKESLGQMTVI